MRRQNITIFDSLSNAAALQHVTRDGPNIVWGMRLKYLHSKNILQEFRGYNKISLETEKNKRRKWNQRDTIHTQHQNNVPLFAPFHLFYETKNKYWYMYAFYYFFLFPLFSTKGCREERIIMVARSDSSDMLSWGASRGNEGSVGPCDGTMLIVTL